MGEPDVIEAIGQLTARERECLRLVDRHLSSKQIARELSISKHTVDAHLDKARRRLGIDDRFAAARALVDHERALDPPIASQPDTIRMASPTNPRLSDPNTGDEDVGRAQAAWKPRSGEADNADQTRHSRLQDPLSQLRLHPGHANPGSHLGSAGTSADGLGGGPSQGSNGSAPGVGDPQAGEIQAVGNGVAGNSLPGLDPNGRVFRSLALRGGGRHALTPLGRLAWIFVIAVVSVLSFGSLLAGLRALQDLG